ncbi:hypothetical protein TRM7615_00955 [Falsiruegeria mediterranea M17]|uniref:Uncharacterized protein n=1 Tax=Falsiruegeria mediterranea M17 TaxID=1200281 RepID=A0A2R8C534_9RHOB|nr:hypothetical protein TRM7615_00955 [Falsiruegeria mediterranea M17]
MNGAVMRDPNKTYLDPLAGQGAPLATAFVDLFILTWDPRT